MKNFTYTITQKKDYFIVSIKGRIMNDESITILLADVVIALEQNSNVILDLEKLDYLNSSGLNCLITILTKSRIKGGETIITNIQEPINKLLLISKLNSVFEIRATVEEAMNEFLLVK